MSFRLHGRNQSGKAIMERDGIHRCGFLGDGLPDGLVSIVQTIRTRVPNRLVDVPQEVPTQTSYPQAFDPPNDSPKWRFTQHQVIWP